MYNSLEDISKEDALSIASSLLYSLRGFPQYSVVSELSYLLDYKSFIKLITYYNGMTIKIPSIDEVNDMLKVLLVYQYYEIEKLSWNEALIKAGYSTENSIEVKNKLSNLKKLLKSQEIGGRRYE